MDVKYMGHTRILKKKFKLHTRILEKFNKKQKFYHQLTKFNYIKLNIMNKYK